MDGWKERRAWLSSLTWPASETAAAPGEMAASELSAFMAVWGEGKTAELLPDPLLSEGYVLEERGDRYVVRGGEKGLLYGAYRLMQCLSLAEPLPAGLQKPYYSLRMLNSWDNMDGTVERGYAGRSLWFEKDTFSYEPDRMRQLGRMLSSVGINVLGINNVNVHAPAQELLDERLGEVKALAECFRPFGIRLMLSVDFSMPLQRGLSTADPLDEGVQNWWKECAGRVYREIPDLAGFLVKADSEHRPGPNEYGRTHAEGANMLARALAPYGGKLVWRAFVYNCMQDWRDTSVDRPCAAYDLYHPLDGSFDENVILQVKNGPYDFQVREPVSPLFYGMEKTCLAVELQLAQEYTGQQIDIYAMAPMWREFFDLTGKEKSQAIAAVSNLGRDDCFTGHPFAACNLFSYGRFAWNPDEDPGKVIREWVGLTYSLPSEKEQALTELLQKSRSVYEKYTAPLGLCWMVSPNNHYGPSPYGYEFQAWGTYNRADRDAVGIDRTAAGTGYVCQYPEEFRKIYEDPQVCPDELLLFFHRLPYSFRMKDGRTLIQRIYDDHFEGFEETEKMQELLQDLPLPEPDRTEVLERMQLQLKDAREWRDVTNTFFHRLSGAEDDRGRRIYL